jgi:hypothetical protein
MHTFLFFVRRCRVGGTPDSLAWRVGGHARIDSGWHGLPLIIYIVCVRAIVRHVYACVNMYYVLRKQKVHTWWGRVRMDEGGPASCSLVG